VQFLPDGFIIDEDDAERSRRIILSFVDEITRTYDVDGRRVFLMGFSQGAIMSLAAGLSEPERFRGIIALNGRLLPQVTNLIGGPERLRDFPIFMAHGVDDRVIQVRYAREAREELNKLLVKLEYHEYPAGHWVTPEVLRDLRSWLKQQVDRAIP
jgi:phospholipase/carboxylesterase